jgi:hypothetical protein
MSWLSRDWLTWEPATCTGRTDSSSVASRGAGGARQHPCPQYLARMDGSTLAREPRLRCTGTAHAPERSAHLGGTTHVGHQFLPVLFLDHQFERSTGIGIHGPHGNMARRTRLRGTVRSPGLLFAAPAVTAAVREVRPSDSATAAGESQLARATDSRWLGPPPVREVRASTLLREQLAVVRSGGVVPRRTW